LRHREGRNLQNRIPGQNLIANLARDGKYIVKRGDYDLVHLPWVRIHSKTTTFSRKALGGAMEEGMCSGKQRVLTVSRKTLSLINKN
jgi:hypothetical protein